MKYSASVPIVSQALSRPRSRVFDPRPASRISAIERKNRILSVACYFGLAPLLWFSGVIRQHNRLLNHHLLYSLAFSFTMLCAVVFDWVTTEIQVWLILDLWQPTLADFDAQIFPYAIFSLFCIVGTLLIGTVWGLAVARSVLGAWRGQTPHIPMIAWVASKFQAIKLAVYWSLLIDVLLVSSIGLGVYSTQVANAPAETADVYVLYTQGGYIPLPGLYETFTPPRWAVTMAFHPLVQAGMERYGDDSVRLLPLSEESFNEAIHNGRFIFVASHGGESPGGFTISNQPHKQYLPTDVAPGQVGEQLQYVYFAGCWTGDLESEWQQVLGLDDAKMFARLSYVTEHMLWAWFRSPGVIAALD